MMKIVSKINELRALVAQARGSGHKVGLVPTMGFLHEGHMSLVKSARKECGFVVVSIFINPTQFGEGEDFETYPQNMKGDSELCLAEGVDIIFSPTPDEVYPEGYQSSVHLSEITKGLCGASREGHFDGVCTVVLKLFNMVAPDKAYFGEKDYQQLQVVKRMVVDLNVDVRVVGVPIVREPDGLAMSSRNTYLDSEERKRALALSLSLKRAKELVAGGEVSAAVIEAEVVRILQSFAVEVDYAQIREPATLDRVTLIDDTAVLAIAGFVGKTRLIDNTILRRIAKK